MCLFQVILLSASTNKLSMSEEEAQEYAALIMEELDDEDLGYIEVPLLKCRSIVPILENQLQLHP